MAHTLGQIKMTFRLVAVVLGFLQAWAYRFYIEPDGVNYLDIAQAYSRREWRSALDAYWSPAYSWALALAQWLFHPSPYWESTLLHLLNFVIFLLALASFEFFFAAVLLRTSEFFADGVDLQGPSESVWWILGYMAFLMCGLRLIGLGTDTPDMALAAIWFLAMGILVRLVCCKQNSWIRYFALGVTLGAGYLIKAVMLPLSAVYILISGAARNGFRRPDARALATLAGFLIVSLPFALALSRQKGYFTFGETGKIAYIHEVSGETVTNLASPVRGPDKIFERPSVYVYDTPFTSSYSAWHDPSYWLDNARPHFSARKQLAAIARALKKYFEILSLQKEWIAGWLVLLLLAGDGRALWQRVKQWWFLYLPALSALVMYGLVLVEPRYVAASIATLWIAVFTGLRGLSINESRKVVTAVVLAITVTTGTALAKDGFLNAVACMHPAKHVQWQVAQGLQRMGATPGEHVAFLGHSTVADYWARLTGVEVTADIPVGDLQSYWSASDQTRNNVADILYKHGVGAIVTATPPATSIDWQAIENTGYYVKFLHRESREDREQSH